MVFVGVGARGTIIRRKTKGEEKIKFFKKVVDGEKKKSK
jgi:hypothetical protein